MSEALTTEIRVEGAQDAINTLAQFFQAYRAGEVDVKKLNAALREQTSAIYGARRSLTAIRTEWRMQHAVWVESARVMRQVGYIGRTLTNMWQAYTIGQIRVERATRSYEESVKDVAEAQRIYNQYLRDFGEESVYTEQAHESLEDAIDAEREASERLRKAQQDLNLGYMSLALQAPTMVSSMISIGGAMVGLKAALVASGATIAAVFTGLGIGAAAASIVVGGALAAIQLKAYVTTGEFLTMKEAWEEFVDSLVAHKPILIDVAGTIREALQDLFRVPEWARWRMPWQWGGEEEEGYQFGLPSVPSTGLYLLHRGERVEPSSMAMMHGRERVRPVNIITNIDHISSELDAARIGDIAYRQLMKRLERSW